MNDVKSVNLPAFGNIGLTSPSAGSTQLEDAAREFEALLTESMLRTMRSSLRDEDKDEEGLGQGQYEDMIYSQLARSISQGSGLGVAKLIQGKLKEQQAAKVAPTGAPGEATGASAPAVPERQARPAIEPVNMPVAGQISSGYGWRPDPFTGQEKFHGGLDIAAKAGTPIVAVEEGKVVFSGKSPQYGNVVVIEHSNKMQTLYAHMAERDVEEGDIVARQQPIGRVGSTGHSTGPHLHFELHQGKRNIDPLTRI